MSLLSQNTHSLRLLHHVHTYSHTPLRFRSVVFCSTSTAKSTRGLSQISNEPNVKQTNMSTRSLTRPHIDEMIPYTEESSFTSSKVSARRMQDDPSLRSTWSHRAWVASGCTTVLISLAKSIAIGGVDDSHIWLAGLIGYVLADLGSGVYHWAIDNYGSAKTPVFGNQIDAFQGHHRWPWTITRREFANNLHALARVVTFTVLPMNLIINDAVVLGFVGMCSGCIMFSQQFHAWAHGTKSKLPRFVVVLQDAGILVSRSMHAAHHQAPYNNNYCIVSGVWNAILDKYRVFEVIEMIFYFKTGVRPRSWNEPSYDWIEDTQTSMLVAEK